MKTPILKIVGRFTGFAGMFLIALMILPFVERSVNAQNKAVSAGARHKSVVSKRAGKNGKIKNKYKNKENQDDEQEDKPRVVKLAPRTGKFEAGTPISKTATSFGVTPALRDMPEVSGAAVKIKDLDGEPVIRDEENNEIEVDRSVPGVGELPFHDPLAIKSRGKFSVLSPQAMPGPALSFNGILGADVIATFASGSMPPDTVGDVGPNNYIQAANFGVFRIFNKSGTPLTATATISTLFSSLPSGDICRNSNSGDPIVNYDPLADRWMISQFYTVAPYGQCVAVSQTSDPTGAWYAYNFPTPNGNFADYPHWAVWTDGYYLATHEFGGTPQVYVQGGFYAFNRNKMLAGDPSANYIYYSDANSFGQLPVDVDGYAPAPTGTSELFIEFNSTFYGGTDSLTIHELVPNYTTPASSTFTLKPALPVAAFDPREPSGRADIEQPVVASTAYLDSISGRSMFRVAYRNLGTAAAPVNSYVMNWTVNVSGASAATTITAATYQAGIRWEELRRDNAGTLSVFDQGTHAPDPASGTGRNRWLGSIGQDNQGNIGLGFSRSGIGATDFPDIVWAGRTGGQVAAGTLNQGEATMHASTGYQNITNDRWGDYSAMTVDPSDDCTYWFTSEWRDAANNSSAGNAPFNWSTRVGNFKFPGCTAAPKGQIASNVTNCATGLPITGASVLAQAGGFLRMTNASGNLISNIIAAPGDYTLTGFKKGYTTSTSAAVTVTDGGTTSGNICLGGGFTILELVSTPAPTPVDENANGRLDPGETATLNIPVKNTGGLDATAVSATLSTTTPGVTILAPQTQPYPDVQKETGTGTNVGPYKFKLGAGFVCGSTIDFTLTVNYNGTTAAQTINFTVATIPPFSVTTTLDTTAPPTAPEYTATTGTQTGRLARSGVASVCGTAKAAPGLTVTTGARQYDAYTFTATSAGCITVTLASTAGTNIYSAAYNSTGFVPSNPNTNFLADAGSSGASVSYGFNVTAGQTFTVVVHEVNVGGGIGTNYTLSLSGPINRGCQTFTPLPSEGDVSTRPGGDGFVDSDDIQQIRQFSVGMGLPYQSNEFQRADDSPRSSSGDGILDGDDVQQARRYAIGTDASQAAAGPSTPSPIAPPVSDVAVKGKVNARTKDGVQAAPAAFRVDAQNTSAGSTLVVPIRVDTVGNEAGYTFSIAFDAAKLTNPLVAIGNGGGDVIFNANNAGQIGFSVTSFSGGTIAAGNNIALVNVTFTVAAGATAGTTPITFTDTPARRKASGTDPNNPITQPTYAAGTITIGGATAAGATISGRVSNGKGRGVANARVIITDSTGQVVQTARTNAFGYYSVADITAGETYIVSVESKQYKFGTRIITVAQDVDGIDFTPQP